MKRLLIANRGEIARRIIRTARQMGIETVAVFGDPDADAAHVADADMSYRLGPAPLAESYLSVERMLAAVRETGADAVHPGYGFLAENTDFAQAVIDAGAAWVGPKPDAISSMGSKIDARRLAAEAGVPVIPGFDGSQDPAELAAAAERIGFPVLVKAAAGGGGKGIRIVHDASSFADALAEAAAEAERSFGDGSMIVERYITRPRHVEVQIVGDRVGNVIHLGTRECSVQRRYQKLLEEAPAPNLPDATRAGLHDAAVKLAEATGYDSAGTVEFIVDDETGEFFFLEMNTRLQVEHPVTEEITDLDLVELMISSARGHALPVTQDEVTFVGHAFECRITAEDPANDFAPQTGLVTDVLEDRFLDDTEIDEWAGLGLISDDPATRWESAFDGVGEVSPHYDSMIAKLIVRGPDRDAALRHLRLRLDGLRIDGLMTTASFHRWLVDQQPIVDARVTTRFLDETTVPADPTAAAAVAAQLWNDLGQHTNSHNRDGHVFSELSAYGPNPPFRVTPHRPRVPFPVVTATGQVIRPGTMAPTVDGDGLLWSVDVRDRQVSVMVDGYPHHFTVPERSDVWADTGDAGGAPGDAVVAPFPGGVTEVAVAVGDAVEAGDKCVVIEAMKMLHTLTAPISGTVAEVRVAAGDQVSSKEVLVTFNVPA